MKSLSNDDIAIVVILFNIGDESLLLERMCSRNYKYIFVDNSDAHEICTDKIKLPNFEYIKNDENLGIATALNMGINKAIKLGYSFAITLDQDSKIDDFFIDELVNSYRQLSGIDEIAILSPSHSTSNILSEKFTLSSSSILRKTYNTMNSGNLVDLEIWRKLGGVDNSLFIDMVDVDYYLKALSHGYDVVVTSNVLLDHRLGNPTVHNFFGKKFVVTNHSPLRKYYRVRNTLVLLKRYRKVNPNIIKKFIKSLFYLLTGVIFFEANKFSNLKHMLLGILDYKRNKLGKFK